MLRSITGKKLFNRAYWRTGWGYTWEGRMKEKNSSPTVSFDTSLQLFNITHNKHINSVSRTITQIYDVKKVSSLALGHAGTTCTQTQHMY
jgi:hypothetical protein